MFEILGLTVSVYKTEDFDKPPISSGKLISITADGIFIIMKDTGHCLCSVPEFSRIHIEDAPGEYPNASDREKEFTEPPANAAKFKMENKAAVRKYIIKLRKKNGTYKEIARLLNKSDIPTFSGTGKWFPQTIHRICHSN